MTDRLYLMFDAIQKGEPVEECKEMGDVVKATGQKNDLFSSILNGYEWDKIPFAKTREKDVAHCTPESMSAEGVHHLVELNREAKETGGEVIGDNK
ncbi:hypothetical protein KIL84_001439 [Mauremys mutica]|uniref:Uncharacterized protein n=1 Tax=Mauremys mutica TaxID=74926 RepID=A0A9D3WUJ7_9SAUR|nr:hypothetical protein KIL84_001439 [Mauremys mutica]